MFRTLRSYLFWTYERGSFHYDVMVTLILLFIFVTPHFINYRDRPQFQLPSQITVENDGSGELVYQVRAQDVQNSLRGGRTEEIRTRRALRRLIEPIAGGGCRCRAGWSASSSWDASVGRGSAAPTSAPTTASPGRSPLPTSSNPFPGSAV